MTELPERPPSGGMRESESHFGQRRHRHRSPALNGRQSLYEWLVLSLVLVAPLAGPWLFGGVRPWSTGSMLVLIFVAGVLFGLRPLLFRTAGHPVFPVALPPLLLFLVWCAVRVPAAAAPYDALLDALRCAGLVLSFWIWADMTSGHHHRWRWLLALLLLSASMMSLYALIQHSQGSRAVLMLVRPEQYEMRASGAFMCPNHFASFIGLVLPVALALFVCRDSGYVLRIFALYAAVVIPPALYLTQSRSGWLGVLLGVAVTVVLLAARRSWRSFWVSALLAPLALAALAVAAWTFSPMVRARVEDALQGNPRLQLWQDTARMIQDAPVAGHGPGAYRWVYPRYWHEMKAFLDPEHAHNEFLEALADYGLVGTVLLAAAAAAAAGALLLRLRSASRDKDASLVAGAMGAGVAALVHACFDYNLHVFGVAGGLVMIFGIATSGLLGSGDFQRREWLGSRARRAAGLLACAACLLLAAITCRAVASYLFTRYADQARLRFEYALSESRYARAIAADSRNPQPWLGLGHLLRIRGTWDRDEARKKADLARAGDAYRAALARNPALLDAEVSLALLYNVTGERDRALATLQAVVEKAPLHRDNLCRLGRQLVEMGRPAEALQTFRRARELGPTEMIDLNIRELEQAGPRP